MLHSILLLTILIPTLIHSLPITFSTRTVSQLIYAGRDNLCLSVQGGIDNPEYYDGAPVISMPCSEATEWDIDTGSGSILVSQQSDSVVYALDAGDNPENNGALKIWQSYPGLYQQTWYYTGDHRIAITGGNQCLDEGDQGVQTYQCTPGNTNQIWYTITATPSASPSSTPFDSEDDLPWCD